ncbi:MAG: hypothetical protein HRT90_07975 [Candidatus Margulisbacteria bacterium]|nr:hypothetical protein [Candidatus Margulisiibacteriota bacterium]
MQLNKNTIRLLADADVIIELHRLQIWDEIYSQITHLYVAETVFDEVRFYRDNENNMIRINMSEYTEINVIVGSIKSSQKILKVSPGIDAGELESLAVLIENDGYYFCSGDALAINTAVLIGKNDDLISLESLIKLTGKSQKKFNQPNFSNVVFKKIVSKASTQRVYEMHKLKENGF